MKGKGNLLRWVVVSYDKASSDDSGLRTQRARRCKVIKEWKLLSGKQLARWTLSKSALFNLEWVTATKGKSKLKHTYAWRQVTTTKKKKRGRRKRDHIPSGQRWPQSLTNGEKVSLPTSSGSLA